MKVLLVVFVILGSCSLGVSQSAVNDFNGLLVYAEVWGHSLDKVTINGEYSVIQHPKFFINAGIGFGAWGEKGVPWITVPVNINAVTKGKKHHFEVETSLVYNEGMVVYPHNGPVGNKSLYLIPSIGYRWQKAEGKWVLKGKISPLYKLKEYGEASLFEYSLGIWSYSLGLSVGYFFGTLQLQGSR